MTQEIIDAVNDGNYAVEVEGPDCIEKCMKYDGTPFYMFRPYDGPRGGSSAGSCSVTVYLPEDNECNFSCNLDTGEWDCSDFEPDEGEDRSDGEQKIIEALESSGEVVCGSKFGMYDFWDVYCAAHPEASDYECYYVETGDYPVNVDDTNALEVKESCLAVHFMYIDGHEEDRDVYMSGTLLYAIYKWIGEHQLDLQEGVTLTKEQLAEIHPDLLSCIEEGMAAEEISSYEITVTAEAFERYLGH